MSTKKHDRPVWRVRVRRTNLPGQKDAMVYVPRVVLRGTLDVKGLAAWASRRSRGHFDPALLELAAAYLMGAARDALVAGYAVDVPLGRLTPSVTGAWNPDRGNPAARAQNQATASFAPGPLLREAFRQALFHEDGGLRQGPLLADVFDMESGTHNERLTPGGYVALRGRYLLMNGDLPERGVELLDDATGRVVCRFTAEEIASRQNTRSRILLRLPEDLPAGAYRLAVTTQCTSNPRPLRLANRMEDHRVLTVVAP